MVVNNNLMAVNTARNLNTHYGRLATSTQRLSTGLRVNGAADDAAGLAIRELQRSDIAAIHQGVRNANDAISLIQTADAALGVIDEKLIRMKELAEQAATGTYDSTQRLMIESEYQQMASEITRIANATDFNGIKLLDGSLKGKHDGSSLEAVGAMKIHFGAGNDSAEDYYYIEIGNCTAGALGVGNTAVKKEEYITRVKHEEIIKTQHTFTPVTSYTQYKTPDGNIYYSDGDYYFSSLNNPAGTYLDPDKHKDIIDSLITEQMTATSTVSYSVYYSDDPDSPMYFSHDNGKTFFTNTEDPSGSILDSVKDSGLIATLKPSGGYFTSIYRWDVYHDKNNHQKEYYTSDGGITFVPDRYKPLENILDSRNPAHKDAINKLEPSSTQHGVSLPTTNYDYLLYTTKDSNKIYYSYVNDEGTKIYVTDQHNPSDTALDPIEQQDIIDNLIPYNKENVYITYAVYNTKGDPNTSYYTYDGGKTFIKNTSRPYDVVLKKPDDDAAINNLEKTLDTTSSFTEYDTYKHNDNDKSYYTFDGGTNFFTNINDPLGTMLSATELVQIRDKLHNANISNYIQLPFDVWEDPNNKKYYTRDGGKTYVDDLSKIYEITLDSTVLADQTIIKDLKRSTKSVLGLVSFLHSSDPNTGQDYYTYANGPQQQYFTDPLHPENIALDWANPTEATIIDGLDPVQKKETWPVTKKLPEKYYVYKDPDTSDLYYSWDGGKTFTSNPQDPDDTTAHASADVAAKLQEHITSKLLVTYVDEVSERVTGFAAGYTVSTQERAQKALVAINEAIESKDKIRAHLGALQNRLENTVTNLTTQAENLQASESRISDVDVATEMTQFVRNQILTQSAVAMLSQANSMPQMAMQLIGG